MMYLENFMCIMADIMIFSVGYMFGFMSFHLFGKKSKYIILEKDKYTIIPKE